MIATLFALAMQVAQPAHRYIQIYGFPDFDSCGSWTSLHGEGRGTQALDGWVLGFVSGRNAYGPGNGDIAPGVKADGLIAWITQYCAAHPLDSVSTAVFRLVDELQRRTKTGAH